MFKFLNLAINFIMKFFSCVFPFNIMFIVKKKPVMNRVHFLAEFPGINSIKVAKIASSCTSPCTLFQITFVHRNHFDDRHRQILAVIAI